jgi:ectoine hydroxylase-related dioxygenase (phytanoyl-CoA dioxygenase family)
MKKMNELNLEELEILGYTIIPNVLSKDELKLIKKSVYEVYKLQEQETEEFFDLTLTPESNIARMPFSYDHIFYNLLNNSKIIPFIKQILGDYFILQTQNAIIVNPNKTHSQNKWHRDFPYMNFVSNPPLAINAFFCITDFDFNTGATQLLPHSHNVNYQPSEEYFSKHGVSVNAEAGSVFLFNTMTFHRTGLNISSQDRIGINHIFSKYILKQQIDIPALLNFNAPEDEFLSMLLGFDSRVPTSILDYRQVRKRGFDKKNVIQ